MHPVVQPAASPQIRREARMEEDLACSIETTPETQQLVAEVQATVDGKAGTEMVTEGEDGQNRRGAGTAGRGTINRTHLFVVILSLSHHDVDDVCIPTRHTRVQQQVSL